MISADEVAEALGVSPEEMKEPIPETNFYYVVALLEGLGFCNVKDAHDGSENRFFHFLWWDFGIWWEILFFASTSYKETV